MKHERIPTAILISGRGSNMQALVRAAAAENYPARVAAVISNRADAAGLAWAEAEGIPTGVVDHKNFKGDRAAFDAALQDELDRSGASLIALAGFMRLLTSEFVNRQAGRMINIHPSLLPAFKGLDTHARTLDAGVRIAGCTVHFVVPEMDAGPIIAQAAVPVLPNDTEDQLASRILACEHKVYPAAIRDVASGRCRLENGTVQWTSPIEKADGAIFSPPITPAN